jgi:TPR repeat protein
VNLGAQLEGKDQFNDAAKLHQKACDGGEPAGCFALGNLFFAADKFERATELWKKACDASDSGACYNLAMATRDGTGVKKDEAAAKKLLAKACKLGEKAACPKKK